MILTDREIRISIESQMIRIDPVPGPDAYSSTSLDLRLGAELRSFKAKAPGLDLTIDPGAADYTFSGVMNQLAEDRKIGDEGFRLEPRTLVLGWTQERVHLRPMARLAARVEGKSSLARLGLAVHVTAPTIHAGFEGQIQLEIINHGFLPIKLRAGMKICQLIFESTMGVADKGYSGQFAGQAAR